MDLTVVATPAYFATMGAEHLWLQRHAAERGPTAGDYERRDTVTSLTMGVGSLLAPLVAPKVFRHFAIGKGKLGKAVVFTALGAAALTTVADLLARSEAADELDDVGRPNGTTSTSRDRHTRRAIARAARRVAAAGGVATFVFGGLAATSTWASRTSMDQMWRRRRVRDMGNGPAALAAAILGWDFIYYWNHRFMHESRYMWAVHVVHHSSERYNLSTALRQPVADSFGAAVPYSALALLGIRPELIATAREVNLLYQYWIHTDTIRRLGRFEDVFNTPSHHRVHHGRNKQYIDRNHGSILISWDRLFGTFEREAEPVVYGLTKNINTFNPTRVAAHEHYEMLRDVARSTSWSERLSYVFRGPGWAYEQHAART